MLCDETCVPIGLPRFYYSISNGDTVPCLPGNGVEQTSITQ